MKEGAAHDLILKENASAWWSPKGSFLPNLEGNVTKCAPHQNLKLITRGKLTFDKRVNF